MIEPGGDKKLANFPQALALVREENDLDLVKDDLDEEINIEDEIKNTAKFEALVDLVNTSFTEAQSTVQEILQLKDDLLMNFLPPPLLFRIAVVFGNLYRAFSDLNTPVYEMLRLVKIFSASWEKNSQLLKKINDLHENKKQLLNIAIKRLANVDKKTKLFAKEKRVQNWEKMFIKLNEAKGHGRRWKFRMETFRNKASAGYTELLKWVLTEPGNDDIGETDLIVPKRKSVRNQRDRKRSKVMIKDVCKKKKQDLNEKSDIDMSDDNMSINTRSNFDDDEERKNDNNFMVEVDDEQEIFSGFGSEKESARKGGREKGRKQDMIVVPKVETSEKEAQTQANVEDKVVWTGEPNYTRYFIVRVFKPVEYEDKALKFNIQLNEDSYTSKNFVVKKGDKKVKIVENAKPKKVGRNMSKDSKKASTETNETDSKVNMNKYEDFLFEIDDNFTQKSKNFLGHSLDNAIKFEMDFDEKEPSAPPCFSSISLDDIHTLDLPILYYKTNEEVQEANFYDKAGNVKRLDRENSTSWLRLNDLTEESTSNYGLLSKRIPYLFDMYNTRQTLKTKDGESVCKLPLMFFWIRKPESLKMDKSTGSENLKDIVEDYTGFDITQITREEIQKKCEKPKVTEKLDRACSVMTVANEPLVEVVREVVVERRMSSPVIAMTPKNYDVIDVKPDLSNEEITAMQETYQLKIDELNLNIYRLENEVAELRAVNAVRAAEQSRMQKMKSIKNGTSRPPAEKLQKIEKSPEPSNEPPTPPRKLTQTTTKSANPTNTAQPMPRPAPQNPSKKQLPASTNEFFERLNFYSEEHTKHHKELYSKYIEEEAYIREQQMVVQHRLDTGQRNQTNKYDDFCLPAVFMPFKSGNSVYNPRAHKYFHPSGSNDIRLTQAPAIFQLPALPAKTSISVINLFDLGRRYQQGEPDYYINEYIHRPFTEHSAVNKTGGAFSQQHTTFGAGTNANLMARAEMTIQLKEEDDYNEKQKERNVTKEPFQQDTNRSQLNINLNNL